MEFRVLQEDEIDEVDLAEIEAVPPDPNITPIDDALGLDELRAKLWFFERGEEIAYHAHAEQEELYGALEGEFFLKLARSGGTETREAGPGTSGWRNS